MDHNFSPLLYITVFSISVLMILGHNSIANSSGVFFRMHSERKGNSLGVVGWVKNTNKGTVVGQVQGPRQLVNEMKIWLSKEGSPGSRITRAVFQNERSIPQLELSGFTTRY